MPECAFIMKTVGWHGRATWHGAPMTNFWFGRNSPHCFSLDSQGSLDLYSSLQFIPKLSFLSKPRDISSKQDK